MAQDSAERFPIGRTALGGAACGLTYDAALQDAVAREDRVRRPLSLPRWQNGSAPPSVDTRNREHLERARVDLPS